MRTCVQSLLRGEADMRREHGVWGVEDTKTRVKRRLRIEHVESRARDRVILQCLCQRFIVNHRAASRVDEDGGGLHERDAASINQVVRLGNRGHVQRKDVGLRAELVK